MAGRLSDREHFSLSDRHLMIACGAAAGLSAVYQVPVASVFFAFETMGIGLSIKNFLLASLSMGLEQEWRGFPFPAHHFIRFQPWS
ncbi:TPA: chloride channel protein [Streptococcus suis]